MLYQLIGLKSETADYWEILQQSILVNFNVAIYRRTKIKALYLKLNQIFVINLLILTESYNFASFIVCVIIFIGLKY